MLVFRFLNGPKKCFFPATCRRAVSVHPSVYDPRPPVAAAVLQKNDRRYREPQTDVYQHIDLIRKILLDLTRAPVYNFE